MRPVPQNTFAQALVKWLVPQQGGMRFNPLARLDASQVQDLQHNANLMYFLKSARQGDPLYQSALRHQDYMVALNILRQHQGLPPLPAGGAFYPGTSRRR